MNEMTNSVIISLRFMIRFLESKLAFIKGIKNYFLPNGYFSSLNGIIKEIASIFNPSNSTHAFIKLIINLNF